MVSRYFAGMARAGLLFASLFGLAVLPIEMNRPSGSVLAVLSAALTLALVNVTLLAIVVGPLIASMCARSRRPPKWWSVGILGAVHGAVYVLVASIIFADREDTVVGTLQFWARVPGELLIHLVPGAVAGIAFGVWVAAGRRAHVAG
jgi:hypothetical protein